MLALQEQPVYRYDQPATTDLRTDWAPPPTEPSAPFEEGVSAPLRALAGDALDVCFRAWRGASGQRYIFSVYDRATCATYEHAVAMIVAIGADGERQIIFVGDTGCFPDIVFARAASGIPTNRKIEFHVHLLATSHAERAGVIADLSQARRS